MAKRTKPATEETFTPGPWTVHLRNGAEYTSIMDSRGNSVGSAYCENQPGNAALMAAAPDLLAACEAQDAVEKHFGSCHQCGVKLFSGEVWHCSEYGRLASDARRLRQDAIAKARKRPGDPTPA